METSKPLNSREVSNQGLARNSLSSKEKSSEKQRQIQINGFDLSLRTWFDKTFKYSLPEKYFYDSIDQITKSLDLLDLPKWFKGVLCYNFSYYMNQELPEVLEESKIKIISLFKSYGKIRIRTVLSTKTRKNRKIRMLWDLLQCKSLCATVPEEFVLDALQKHRKIMAKQPPLPKPEILESVSEFVSDWVDEVYRRYDNFTSLPNTHSNMELPRSKGGNRGYFKKLNAIRSNTYLSNDKSLRMDPITIHLQGPPGFGKSTSIRKICHQIQKAFGVHIPDPSSYGPEVYSRSSACDHWDGYEQQLITVIDDFAFEGIIKNTSVSNSSYGELLQLCSDCDFVLPMAHLKNKGMTFTSKFIIISSNQAIEDIARLDVAEPSAFQRRISPTYLIKEYHKDDFIRLEFKSKHNNGPSSTKYVKNYDGIMLMHANNQSSSFGENYRFHATHDNIKCNDIVQETLSRYVQGHTFRTGSKWIQSISHFKGASLGIEFKLDPPSGIPTVKTAVVKDPLKARIITIPEADTYCLKSLQLAMFDALKKWKCFEPCWNPGYDLSQLNHQPDRLLLSGDYTSATDNLNYHVSQIVMKKLIEKFKFSYPQISKWIAYEGQNHLVQYPEKSGLPDVLQENGQLMGSLLSFPILTILNAWTLCKATNSNLDSVRGLFHGDDIAASLTSSEIESWKSYASQIGLDLSIGKNYISKDFVSIDSQLFCLEDSDLNLKKQKTGKFKLISRGANEVFTCKKALENGFDTRQIRTYCQEQLKKTVRSLDIPESYGGLGDENSRPGRPLTIHEKLVYLAIYEMKGKCVRLHGDIAMIEKSVATRLRLEKTQMMVEDEKDLDSEQFEIDLKREVSRLHRLIIKNSRFANFVKNLDLFSLRPLSMIKRVTTRCANYSFEEIERVQQSMLGLLSRFPKNQKSTSLGFAGYRMGPHEMENSVSKKFFYNPHQSMNSSPKSPLAFQEKKKKSTSFLKKVGYSVLNIIS